MTPSIITFLEGLIIILFWQNYIKDQTLCNWVLEFIKGVEKNEKSLINYTFQLSLVHKFLAKKKI